jgi:hypothetical protein
MADINSAKVTNVEPGEPTMEFIASVGQTAPHLRLRGTDGLEKASIGVDGYFYFGPAATEGSFRIGLGTGDNVGKLVAQRYTSGAWGTETVIAF